MKLSNNFNVLFTYKFILNTFSNLYNLYYVYKTYKTLYKTDEQKCNDRITHADIHKLY